MALSTAPTRHWRRSQHRRLLAQVLQWPQLCPWPFSQLLLFLLALPRPSCCQDDGGDMGDDSSSMVDPSLLMEDDTAGGMGQGGMGGVGSSKRLSLEVAHELYCTVCI